MNKQEIQKKLGERIVLLRTQKGLKQIDLAQKLEIEDSALRRIEKGKTNCTIWTLHLISKALEVSLPDLLNFDTPQ